jgi:hypothetical protein
VKKREESRDKDAKARMKMWTQGLYFLLNPAAVGSCRPRLLGRDPIRFLGLRVRGLSVPLMLLASYLGAKRRRLPPPPGMYKFPETLPD